MGVVCFGDALPCCYVRLVEHGRPLEGVEGVPRLLQFLETTAVLETHLACGVAQRNGSLVLENGARVVLLGHVSVGAFHQDPLTPTLVEDVEHAGGHHGTRGQKQDPDDEQRLLVYPSHSITRSENRSQGNPHRAPPIPAQGAG